MIKDAINGIEAKEIRFSIGATPEGDSVISWGKVSEGIHGNKYFGEYAEALEWLRKQFEEFACDHIGVCDTNGGICPKCGKQFEFPKPIEVRQNNAAEYAEYCESVGCCNSDPDVVLLSKEGE